MADHACYNRKRESILRISFLILFVNALFFTQIASAVSQDTKIKGALLKAMKTHDTSMVRAIADGGYESIDRDDGLQERIYDYLNAERERDEKARLEALATKKSAEDKAKADVIAQQKAEKEAAAAVIAAEKAAADKKKQDAIAAQNKAKADALAKEEAQLKAAAAAVAARKAAKNKASADAVAKQNAEKKAAVAAVAAKKAATEKKKKDALAAKKAQEKKARQAKAAEQKRKADAKKKAAAQKQAKPKKAAPKKSTAKKTVPKVKAVPVVAAPIVAAPVVAAAKPLTISDKKLIGTWKQVSSEKVITLNIEKDTNFILEQVEEDGTLTLTGTWKSEENIFMLSIKKVQRNVHSRETNIHRIYKVERLSKHRLVLRDKRNRIAYDLKR